jgi:hypothetical protein
MRNQPANNKDQSWIDGWGFARATFEGINQALLRDATCTCIPHESFRTDRQEKGGV